MIYFQNDPSGEVYAYSASEVDAGFVLEGLREMTSSEVEAHLNPTPVWWTNGADLVMAVYGADGWHAATQDEVDSLLPAYRLQEALAKQATLRAVADQAIAPLQDAEDIGEATADEEAQLALWKKYRVDLSRVTKQPDYPTDIAWPAPPA